MYGSVKDAGSKLADMPNKADSLRTIESLLDIVIQRYSNIHFHYKSASIIEKRKLIGSMYPKNLCFDGREHRTPYLSGPLSLILQINRQLQGIKKGEKLSFDNLSPLVARRGIEPLFLEWKSNVLTPRRTGHFIVFHTVFVNQMCPSIGIAKIYLSK